MRLASLLAAGGVVAQRYEGTLGGAGGSAPLVLFFVGRAPFAREFERYFHDEADPAHRIEPAATSFHGSVAQLALHRGALAREAARADLVACEVFPGALAHADDLLHRPMLDAMLTVESSLERQIRRMKSCGGRRLMRAVIKRDAYVDWVATGPEAFETFHATLHEPYVRARFGAWGAVDDVAEVRRRYAKGGRILFVARRDRPSEPVCGTLLFDLGGGALAYQLNGFADAGGAGDALIAERTAALEVALIEHAIAGRYARIDLGYTRAILSDGLFVHKRRLGCTFAPVAGSPAFRVHVRAGRRAEVFARFPLLVGDAGAWTAVLGYDDGAPRMSKKAWRAVLKGYRVPGLVKAVVWSNARGDRAKEPLGEPAFRAAITETLDLPDGLEFRSDE